MSRAIDDGRRAAQRVARQPGQYCDSTQLDVTIAAALRTQHALAQLFAEVPVTPLPTPGGVSLAAMSGYLEDGGPSDVTGPVP